MAIGFKNKFPFTETGDIGNGNYMIVGKDGVPELQGDSTIWVDIDFPIIIRTAAANRPVVTTVKGNLSMPLWIVDDYYQFDSQEIIHSYKQGSDGRIHIHIITNGTDIVDKFLRFEFEYNYANVNESWKTNNITIDSGELLIPANTPANTNLIFSIGIISDLNLKIAAHIKARLKRITSIGDAPTLDPFCDMVQIHVEQDTWGSREIGTK